MKYPNNGSFAVAQASIPRALFFDGVTRETRVDFDNMLNTVYHSAAFSPDKTLLVFGAQLTPYVQIFDTATMAKLPDPATLPNGWGYGVAFNHDGSLLAVAHSVSPYITIYNTNDWSKVANPVTLPTGTAYALAFNHDGSLLAVAHQTSPYITIYNTSDWSKVANPVTLPASTARGVAFNHDGSLLAVAHQSSPYITIYNTNDWSKVANPVTLPNSTAYDVAFSPDGSRLAVAHQSGLLTLYDTADWSSIPVGGISFLTLGSTGYGVEWVNNDEFLFACNGQPGLVRYARDGTVVEQMSQFYSVNGVAAIKSSGWEINGTISESLAADTWIASAYDLASGKPVGRVTFTGTAFTIPVANPTPVSVTVEAVQGEMWQASESSIAIGDKCYPTDPSATPYYYEATGGGTTGVGEPVWPITDGGTVGDGTVTWQRVERLIQPITQSPLIPTPV